MNVILFIIILRLSVVTVNAALSSIVFTLTMINNHYRPISIYYKEYYTE